MLQWGGRGGDAGRTQAKTAASTLMLTARTEFEFGPNSSRRIPQPKSMAEYKPSATRTSDSTIATFITAELEEDLSRVPGVGPANKACFEAAGVTTTHQLLAKLLSFKGEVRPAPPSSPLPLIRVLPQGVPMTEVCDNFYLWLKEVKVNSNRASIIKALAEKVRALRVPPPFPRHACVPCS